MEFKKLELEPESNKFKKAFQSTQVKKTIIFALIGAVAGFLYIYFSNDKILDGVASGEIAKSIMFGGFMGLFITNSPCARNKC